MKLLCISQEVSLHCFSKMFRHQNTSVVIGLVTSVLSFEDLD